MRNLIVASVLGLALVTAGVAYAGDEAPAKPAKTDAAPMTAAEKPATATPSPIHSMMKWVASHVMEGDGCGCPSTAEGEKAWRAWFKADSPKLASLRKAMMADGWNADKTIGFFKEMAKQKAGSCDCENGTCDCCGNCDKAKGAAAATGDAGKTGDAASKGCCGCDKAKGKGCCGGCDKAKGAAAATGDAGKTGDAAAKGCCGGCDKSKGCCGGCDKAKGAAAAKGDAGKTGDAAAKGCCNCDKAKGKGCCGGCNCDKAKGAAAAKGDAGTTGDAAAKGCCNCDKSKCKDCCGGCNCDKAKKTSGQGLWWWADKDDDKGAAAAKGDAGKTGDEGTCPCTGKPMKDCTGCGKEGCKCGKDNAAKKAAKKQMMKTAK